MKAALTLTKAQLAKALGKKTKLLPTEADEQRTVMDWAGRVYKRYPEVELLYAIPNGAQLGGNNRFATANFLKARGLKPGVPDLCLPVARGTHYALYLEMKRAKGGQLSPEQQWWQRKLMEQGCQVSVCFGAQDAIDTIEAYLSLGTTKSKR